MTWFTWLLVGCAAVWGGGALVTVGVLAERERLQNADGERGWPWVLALGLSSVLWPFVAGLWGASRPVPTQPPRPPFPLRAQDFYAGRVGNLSSYVWEGQPGAEQATAVMTIDRPGTLAVLGEQPFGQRVFVKELGFVLQRGQLWWSGVECTCRYNFLGFPVVLCRVHRSDVDPQGEPDESEGEVGL